MVSRKEGDSQAREKVEGPILSVPTPGRLQDWGKTNYRGGTKIKSHTTLRPYVGQGRNTSIRNTVPSNFNNLISFQS